MCFAGRRPSRWRASRGRGTCSKRGQCRATSGHLALALGGTLRISGPAPAGVCHAVVRAEDITVLPAQHSRVGEGDSFFTGCVRRVVCEGTTAVVEVDVPPLFRAAVSARELEAFAIEPGSKVGLRVPAAAVHVV